MVNNTEQTLASKEYVIIGKLRTRKNTKMVKKKKKKDGGWGTETLRRVE